MLRSLRPLRRAVTALSCTLAAVAAPAAVHAQAPGRSGTRSGGGQFPDGLPYWISTRVAGEGRTEREWLRAMILWRVPAGATRFEAHRPDSAASAAAERRYTALRRGAEDAGRSFVGAQYGTTILNAAADRDGGTLWVADERFEVPTRDTALVVMAEVPDAPGATARVVGHARLRAVAPLRTSRRSWTSGDTTFFVSPRGRERELRTLLRTDPAVRAFLDGARAAGAVPPRRPDGGA